MQYQSGLKTTFCRILIPVLLTILGPAAALATYPTVQANNLTHPGLSPSFVAGDTYQYVVTGDPNQPVYTIQNSGPQNLVGYTNASGVFIETGVEQAAWVGNYTQTWFVGTIQISPDINFSVTLATVVPFNVTHPYLSPSFLAGDSYQYTVYGRSNQPVYTSQNAGPSNLVGWTDGSGYFRETGVEQTAWIGNYTQVWSVGNVQVSPALTFFVGQRQPGGTVTSTDIGQTSNGSVTGTSIISVSNGTVNTYSATELGYAASLYYNAQTVGTLYQERTAIAGGVTPILGGRAAGYLSTPAINWNDYDLQTDHYVVAYFITGGLYQNPLYFSQGSCYDAYSDCTLSGGSGAYWIQAASIYLGSTLADQTNIPQDGSVPAFPDALYDNFLASSRRARLALSSRLTS